MVQENGYPQAMGPMPAHPGIPSAYDAVVPQAYGQPQGYPAVPPGAPGVASPHAPVSGADYLAAMAAASRPAPASAPAPSAAAPVPAPASAPAAAFAPAAPAAKGGRGWIVAIVVVLCLTGLAVWGISSCSRMLGLGPSSSAITHDNTVAVINLDSSIRYDGSSCSPEGFGELLYEAQSNDRVKAVVLRVNSGGGTAAAGEEMSGLLRDFPKPVVVSSASINASAAYEISSQADYIYVAKSSEVGSIGTAIELMDYSGLMDMLGIHSDVITSSDGKDSSYGLRPLTDEERAHYQHMVDQINRTFIETVALGRDMTIAEVEALATGMTYTGIDAVENGLADEIGTREDALNKAAALAGLESYYVAELSIGSYDLDGLGGLLGNRS